jgi:hypothetical protein
MVTSIGYGTTFTWNLQPVGHLTRIGGVSVKLSKVDSTTLEAIDWYKTMLPGLLDPGDVALEGWFRPDNAGQAAVLADMLTRTERAWVITFPTALSSATWSGNGYITGFEVGDATPEGIIPWSATLSITGEPVLGVDAATGPTDILLTGDISGALPEVPTYAAGIYLYSVDGSAENTFTVTVTAAGADLITVNGSTVATGVPSAAINTLPGEIVTVTVVVHEDLKSDKSYTIYVVDGL